MKKTVYVYRIDNKIMLDDVMNPYHWYKGAIWIYSGWWCMEEYDDLASWLDTTHANIIITDDYAHPDDWWEERCGDGRYTFEFLDLMEE